MKLVIIESPYSGDTQRNTTYAAECLKDSIDQGEAPFASHLLYPGVLNEEIKEERLKGIILGYSWMARADLVAVYIDLGISKGMKLAIERAKQLNIPVEFREIYSANQD